MLKNVSYEEAFAGRPPREVVIAIARDAGGKFNPITLGMFSHVSNKPPVLMVAINKVQYSIAGIRAAKEFVIALPGAGQLQEAALYGARSGRDCDKFALAGAKTVPATKINGVLLAEAAANYECKLIAETPIGSHIVFFGEVVAAHVADPPVRRLYIIGPDHEMGPLPG